MQNQSGQSGTVAQTSIINSPVTFAVNSISQAGSNSTNPSFNARPSSSRLMFLHTNNWDVLLYFLNRDYAAVHVLPSYLRRRRGDIAVDGNRTRVGQYFNTIVILQYLQCAIYQYYQHFATCNMCNIIAISPCCIYYRIVSTE